MVGTRRGQASTLGAIVGLVLLCTCNGARAADASARAMHQVSLWSKVKLATFGLVPSPMLVIGAGGGGGGVRWQVTPVLYSFGIAERPLRFFLVAPVARHVGAIEFYGSPEWACCADASDSGWMVRAGARVYWPVVGRGETLAMSAGGSYYYENRRHGGAAEIGLFTLSSIFGVTVTVSPWLRRREVIFALVLRYF